MRSEISFKSDHVGECEICGSRLIQSDATDWVRQGRKCQRCGEFWIDTVSDGLRVVGT
jgi:hypothetical protein